MLKLQRIVKDYQAGDTTVHALRGVSLQFRESEFVALLGHSLELGGVQGNHGDFRHGKKCVQKNEHGLHEQLPEYVHE